MADDVLLTGDVLLTDDVLLTGDELSPDDVLCTAWMVYLPICPTKMPMLGEIRERAVVWPAASSKVIRFV